MFVLLRLALSCSSYGDEAQGNELLSYSSDDLESLHPGTSPCSRFPPYLGTSFERVPNCEGAHICAVFIHAIPPGMFSPPACTAGRTACKGMHICILLKTSSRYRFCPLYTINYTFQQSRAFFTKSKHSTPAHAKTFDNVAQIPDCPVKPGKYGPQAADFYS